MLHSCILQSWNRGGGHSITLEKNSDESAAYINQWISRTVGVQGWLNHLSAGTGIGTIDSIFDWLCDVGIESFKWHMRSVDLSMICSANESTEEPHLSSAIRSKLKLGSGKGNVDTFAS